MPTFKIRNSGDRDIKAKFLVADPLNWRGETSEEQRVGLDGILAEVGFVGRLLVRPHPEKRNRWFVVDGHERLTRFDPDDLVPCTLLDVTEAEARKLLASYDPLGYLKSIDADALARLRRSIGDFDFDGLDAALDLSCERMGIDLDEPTSPAESRHVEFDATAGDDDTEPEPDPDRLAELHAKWETAVGQLWEISSPDGMRTHRLACGSNDDADLVARTCVDPVGLVFTSPPYSDQRDYGKKVTNWDSLLQATFEALPATTDDAQVLVNLGIVHRDGEWIPYWETWIAWMREQGWKRFGWYVWDQGPGLPGDWKGRFAPSHEFVFHFNRAVRRPQKVVPCTHAGTKNKGQGLRAPDGIVAPYNHAGRDVQDTRIRDSVIRATRHKGRGVECSHPAVFSIAFAEALIESFPGTTYDPFLGSGSTMVAAERLGQTCYGLELEPPYVALALERMSALGCTPRLVA